MGEPLLVVEKLSKTYPKAARRFALADVDFDIAEGEIVGLIGPNGAGKSTLIRILAGVLLPTSGSARLGPLSLVRDQSDVRRRVGIAVGDERGLSPRLTVEENLRFFGALYKMRANEVLGRMKELEEPLESGSFFQRRVQTLSSGERARAALLRAYLHRPQLLLLDELTRSLDPGAAPRIRKWIVSDAARHGMAVLFASHDLMEIQSVAARVLLLSAGRAAAFGPYRELEPTAERVFLN